MISLSDLNYEYPEELIAREPLRPSRVMWVNGNSDPEEISIEGLLGRFQTGDLLVINETYVERRRVFGFNKRNQEEIEVLFVGDHENRTHWDVLMPASRINEKDIVILPEDVELRLVKRGLPQLVETSRALTQDYFSRFGEVPLPPYIQKARGERRGVAKDPTWYQSAWAKNSGSSAAPTASLHFQNKDFEVLRKKGVAVEALTLHVGLGTYLPISAKELKDHVMHAEPITIPAHTWAQVQQTLKSGKRVWALGTTVCRALESMAAGLLHPNPDGSYQGNSRLFIHDDFNWQIVGALLTNFHQPQTTLLALVASFSTLENVKRSYQWAIQNRFRLFSYGDLSVWLR